MISRNSLIFIYYCNNIANKSIKIGKRFLPLIFVYQQRYKIQGVFLVLSKVICLFGGVMFILETNRGCHMNP